MRTWYLTKHTATRADLKSRFCCLKWDVNELGYLSPKSSWHGYSFAPVNNYSSFSAYRAAAHTQHHLKAKCNLIPLGFSMSFKVAKPTSYFQIKLDIWSQQNHYYPLKLHNPCLGCLWCIFYGVESGSLSQMCRMYPIPHLLKNIQSHLSWEVFSCHAGQGLLFVHHYSNTISPSSPQLFLLELFLPDKNWSVLGSIRDL